MTLMSSNQPMARSRSVTGVGKKMETKIEKNFSFATHGKQIDSSSLWEKFTFTKSAIIL